MMQQHLDTQEFLPKMHLVSVVAKTIKVNFHKHCMDKDTIFLVCLLEISHLTQIFDYCGKPVNIHSLRGHSLIT